MSTRSRPEVPAEQKSSLASTFAQLKFKLDYDFTENCLSVHIFEARDLDVSSLRRQQQQSLALQTTTSTTTTTNLNPYVRIVLCMANNQEIKFETKPQRKTANPNFNETFKFKLEYSDVSSASLRLQVLSFDSARFRVQAHEQLGRICIPLSSIDLAQSQAQWRNLLSTQPDEAQEKLGDICFSLRYVPTLGKLTVVVLEARGLKKMDLTGLSDPYVKMIMFADGRRLKKKKTSIKRETLNPFYNESFTFDLPLERIHKTKLQITVMDYDRIGSSDCIGSIELSAISPIQSESRHWLNMLASPRRTIAQWHTLRPLEAPQPGRC